MKYYIPTSSLNFTNIISTESISPASFYSERGFGMSRFYPLEEGRFDDIILLYDKPHSFKRPESDLEDHPMLIEITTDDKSFTSVQDGIYKSEETIYLTFCNTRFIFFTNEHMNAAMMHYASSQEAKLLPLYRNRISVENYDGEFPHVDAPNLAASTISTMRKEFLSKDQKINRMKGLLYGYYIGAILSSDAESVKEISILTDIYNIFSSIITSPKGDPTDSQRRNLYELFDKLTDFTEIVACIKRELGNSNYFEKLQSFCIQKIGLDIKKVICERSGDIPDPDYLLGVLANYCQTINNAKRANGGFGKSNSSQNLRSHSAYKSIDGGDMPECQAMSWIKDRIKFVEEKIKKSRTEPAIGKIVLEDLQLDNVQHITDVNAHTLYVQCVNKLFTIPQYTGKISTFNVSLARDITYKAKDIFGASWESSQERKYLNGLIQHLGGAEFIHQWSNELLPSIAAVLIRGDDWRNLLRFMQSKGMYDYRIAFSIYGALNGFANLLRDFTDNVMIFSEKWIINLYKEIHWQLFQKEIPASRLSSLQVDYSQTDFLEKDAALSRQGEYSGHPHEHFVNGGAFANVPAEKFKNGGNGVMRTSAPTVRNCYSFGNHAGIAADSYPLQYGPFNDRMPTVENQSASVAAGTHGLREGTAGSHNAKEVPGHASNEELLRSAMKFISSYRFQDSSAYTQSISNLGAMKEPITKDNFCSLLPKETWYTKNGCQKKILSKLYEYLFGAKRGMSNKNSYGAKGSNKGIDQQLPLVQTSKQSRAIDDTYTLETGLEFIKK